MEIPNVKHDKINNLDLRSDIENAEINNCTLVPRDFNGFIWTIDCLDTKGITMYSYNYTSKTEYNQDVKLIS